MDYYYHTLAVFAKALNPNDMSLTAPVGLSKRLSEQAMYSPLTNLRAYWFL